MNKKVKTFGENPYFVAVIIVIVCVFFTIFAWSMAGFYIVEKSESTPIKVESHIGEVWEIYVDCNDPNPFKAKRLIGEFEIIEEIGEYVKGRTTNVISTWTYSFKYDSLSDGCNERIK